MDVLTKDQRSAQMALIGGKDSVPELKLRRLVHAMGFRYVLHDKRLPGKPDMVFPARGCVIFMHGCFWHRHRNCKLARLPKSRMEFWTKKLDGNRRRDLKHRRDLGKLGWRVLVVWECELRDLDKISSKVREFLVARGE